MSDAVTIALIAGAPGVLASVLGFITTVLAQRNQRRLRETKHTVNRVLANLQGRPDPPDFEEDQAG